MNFSEEDIILIDEYLEGNLSGSSLQHFEERLKQDAFFHNLVNVQRDVNKSLEKIGEDELRSKMTGWQNESGKKVKVVPINKTRRAILALAATVLLALGAAAIFSIVNVPQNEKLFTEHYEAYPCLNCDRSEIEEAFQEYAAGNYAEALKMFESKLSSNPDDTEALFYAGNCYLSIENPDLSNAIKCFSKIINNFPESQLRIASNWYLGLAYLKNNETNKALKIFSELEKSGTSYRDKASEIIENL